MANLALELEIWWLLEPLKRAIWGRFLHFSLKRNFPHSIFWQARHTCAVKTSLRSRFEAVSQNKLIFEYYFYKVYKIHKGEILTCPETAEEKHLTLLHVRVRLPHQAWLPTLHLTHEELGTTGDTLPNSRLGHLNHHQEMLILSIPPD